MEFLQQVGTKILLELTFNITFISKFVFLIFIFTVSQNIPHTIAAVCNMNTLVLKFFSLTEVSVALL